MVSLNLAPWYHPPRNTGRSRDIDDLQAETRGLIDSQLAAARRVKA